MVTSAVTSTFDMKRAITNNRLVGLIRMMSGFRWLYSGAIIGLAIATMARTGAYLLIAYFVDEVLLRTDLPVYTPLDQLDYVTALQSRSALLAALPIIVLGFLLLAVAQGAFSFLSGRWAAHTAESVAWRLRNYLYDHIQRLTFSYHDRMQTGELLQRSTSDVDALRRFYVEQGVGIGRIILMFTVNFVAILFISIKLGLLSILIIPLLIALSLFFFRRISASYEAFQDQEARLSTTLQENLSGIRVVKAFARQNYEQNKFERENWEKFIRGRGLTMLHAVYWPLTDVLTGSQIMFGYFIGALMVMNGDITIGGYLAYMGMVWTMVEPMRQLGRLIVQTSTGLVSYERIAEIIKVGREPLDELQKSPVEDLRGAVEFDHVSFAYDADTPVLHDISFRCEPGKTVALVGSTGSGKTSLVALLPRFYDYTSGSIRLDGIELREFPRDFLRRNIGIVEQEPFLFSRTIRENITFGVGRDVTDEEVSEAARAAAIHDVIRGFPQGYKTLVGERGVTLSGGQKQRVVLARTLLKDPRILILDDATSSVDTETEVAIRRAVRRMMDGCTTFIIAHRITTVMHADMVLVMDQGRIVQSGTHDQLIYQDGIYRSIFEMQSRIEADLERELADVG